jgi:streptogramin lyase
VPTIPATTSAPRQNIAEIAAGLGSPDDLALLPDGSILFSDESKGTVDRVLPNGQVTTLVRGLETPEGIVPLPDGSLLIAEQGRNRIVRFQAGRVLTTWFALQNSRGGLGVDGIARDPKSGDIIIPDSPNGRVLRVDANGKNERVLASGFARPTGADVAPDGTVLIADETGDQVYRIRPDGQKESLGHFAMPDDVVAAADGSVFVASLADNSIREVDARTHAARLIATVQGPQGLVLAPDGSLVVSEPARHRLLRIRP